MNRHDTLPFNWKWVTIAQILDGFESGGRPKGGVKGIVNGIPSVGGEHLQYDGGFDFSNIKYIPEPYYRKMTKGKIRINDVLVVKDGATTGKTSIVTTTFPYSEAAVNEHVFILRPKPQQVVPKFLFYWLLSPFGNKCVKENFRGTAQGGITSSFITNSNFPLVPIDIQERIINKIEEIFTQLDAGTAALKRVQAGLKRYKATVLMAAVEGRLMPQDLSDEPAVEMLLRMGKKPLEGEELPSLPEGWCWTHLQDIGAVGRGKSKHRPRNAPFLYGGVYPFIQTGDIRLANGTINSYSQTYNEAGLLQSKLWKKGTLCITIAANIAETAILGFDACFPDSIVGYVPCDGTEVSFIQYFISTAKENLERFAPATAQKNINLDILHKVIVPLPPTKEQHRIVAEVERRLSLVTQGEKVVSSLLTRSARLRQSILKQAFEGKLLFEQSDKN